jgi:DNA polymerase I-like protein with 3'-5' exonuclease and polymerase domains
MVVPIINQPLRLCKSLEHTRSPVVLDLETTGLTRSDQIVSAGLLVECQPHVLFVRSRVVPCVTIAQFRVALEPLSDRPDLTIVGHNFGFDLGMLWREEIMVAGCVHDTELLLRLLDSDRGKNKDVLSARIDRLAPPGTQRLLNYRLKDVVPQLLGLRMVGYNNQTPMDVLPYAQHVLYLTSDLLGTAALYEYLLDRLTPEQQVYNETLIAPLTPLLVEMAETGIKANTEYLKATSARLQELMDQISEEHRSRFGVPLGMDQRTMCGWLFGELGLRPTRFKRRTARERALGRHHGSPSLDTEHLESLRPQCGSAATRSLDLIVSYRKAAILLVGLTKLLPYVDYHDRRIRTSLHPRQATGRISSTKPNLQGISKSKTIGNQLFRSRNALMASEGYILCAFDVKNADIRVMANAIAKFPCSAAEHLRGLHSERLAALRPIIKPHLDQLSYHRNPAYSHPGVDPPVFDPGRPCALRAILEDPGVDLYEETAQRVLGKATVTKDERNTFKTIVLSLSNSMGAQSLAKKLGYGLDKAAVLKARTQQDAFWAAFPQVYDYLELSRWQVALTGQTTTWAGRTRVCTAHKWMVSLPKVEVLLSYACGEWYWLDVIPLRPGRRCLTVWIRRVWDATYTSSNHGKLVYEDYRGPLCARPYRLFQTSNLLYKLPVRGVAWRSIRRVRTDGEEAQYHGFDATARSLINHVFQGGTADLAKTMMLRAAPLCNILGARMLLQIHDELVFEVRQDRVAEFVVQMKVILEGLPTSTWQIPIRVEAKTGQFFGEMKEVK